MDNILGQRIKERRNAKNLTQKKLSKLVEVESNTVYKWEQGMIKPSIETCKVIAFSLNTSVAYLMGETNDPQPVFTWDDLSIEHGKIVWSENADATPLEGQMEKMKDKTPPARNATVVELEVGIEIGKRYILPATAESYDFLERLNESESQSIGSEKMAVLKMMEGMTKEEIRDMFDFLSKKESKAMEV